MTSSRARLSSSAGELHWLQAPPSVVDDAVRRWWQALPQQPEVLAVAFSSGADSTALLLAVWRMAVQARQRDAAALPRRVVALHVHHGLQEAADRFEAAGEEFCRCLRDALATQSGKAENEALRTLAAPPDLAWRSARVTIALAAGDSLEARAREERYTALARMAQEEGAGVVLLGHHADDQAESVLLALSRGAGVAGLAGMSTAFTRQGSRFARPLLEVPGQALRDWLRELQIPWQEDPSNTDLRFTRNRLRHTVLPVLEEHFPGFRTSVARSARLAAQAVTLLQELAQIDLQQIGNPPQIAQLHTLAPHRQANALRHWLKTAHGVIGSESQMLALLQVIAACQTRGHRIHIKVGNGYVSRNGPVLQWQAL